MHGAKQILDMMLRIIANSRILANEHEEGIDFPAVAGKLVNALTMPDHTLDDIISIVQRRNACVVIERMRESRESFSQWIAASMARGDLLFIDGLRGTVHLASHLGQS